MAKCSYFNKELILGRGGGATFTQLSGVQILDKEVFHYSTYPDSSDTSFKRQGECKGGMVSHLDYLGYLSLVIK